MTVNGWLQILLYCVLLLLTVRPLGGHLHRLFAGERVLLTPVLAPVERAFYRLAGVDAKREHDWLQYSVSMLLFNALGFLALYLILRTQAWLPLNPQHLPNLSADLAFNTAISFTTNTNWQAYSGESSMSYLSQMLGLTVQNFLSAATGIALALALIRGFARKTTQGIGNAWVDLTRALLYLLLPMCLLFAMLLVWQGVPQNFASYTEATTLEGAKQLIAQGPIASQEAIKMLGTNGGGFLNANSAHPFENPGALSNLLEMLSIFLIGAALTDVFGRAVNNRWQGHAILGAMLLLFLAGVAISYWAESAAPSALSGLDGVQISGNLEGKETRFGIASSALFAVITTAASCGAVNAMHDSFTALGGAMPLFNILLGEVIIGGVGAGFYGMMLYALIAIFMAGLMVGRTPEYVGKKIEAREVKLAMLAVLAAPLAILLFTAIACVLPEGLKGLNNAGPHGFSEILYAYASAAGNNGSAFAGLSANSLFYNTTLGITMLIGRFAIIVPMLAIAGSLAAKKQVPASAGTLPTDGGLFVALLIAVVLVFGGLTFLPALVLGPVAEHYAMLAAARF